MSLGDGIRIYMYLCTSNYLRLLFTYDFASQKTCNLIYLFLSDVMVQQCEYLLGFLFNFFMESNIRVILIWFRATMLKFSFN